VIEWKAKGLNEMQAGTRIGAKTHDVASVWRYLWVNQHDVDIGGSPSPCGKIGGCHFVHS
jgi:transposase-like protein